MKYSTRLSDAIHILAFIVIHREQLPGNMGMRLASSDIAASIHTNPSFVRQLMMKLKHGGLLLGEQGVANPRLTRAPQDITLHDIYKAVEGEKPLLHLNKDINAECQVGTKIQMALQDAYDEVQNAAEAKMKNISLQDILDSYSMYATNSESKEMISWRLTPP